MIKIICNREMGESGCLGTLIKDLCLIRDSGASHYEFILSYSKIHFTPSIETVKFTKTISETEALQDKKKELQDQIDEIDNKLGDINPADRF